MFAISLITQASFGQDRSEGLVQLKTQRGTDIDIYSDMIRVVKTDAKGNTRYNLIADGRVWRMASTRNRYQSRGATQYYRYSKSESTSQMVRNEIRRGIQETRSAIREAIRSALRVFHVFQDKY